MKRLFAGLIVTIMTISLFSIQAFATSESDILQYMKDKGFAQTYIVTAENHFKSYDYTSAQLDSAKSYCDKLLEIINAKNPEVITKGGDSFNKNAFTDAEEDQIVDYVVKAAASLNIKAVVTRGPDTIRYVEFYNTAGKKIGSITPKYNTLKLTGNALGSTTLYAIFLSLFVAVLCLGTVVVKNTLYTKKVS